MATSQQIEQGAVRFIDGEIAPKIPTNVPNGQIKKIFALAGAAYAVRNGLGKALSSPALAAIGAVDGEGNVDVEGLAEAALAQIPKGGFKVAVPILGELTFFAEDVERLKAYIMEE
nr:hypothetical protein [uncultured Oscillibacter sp.]